MSSSDLSNSAVSIAQLARREKMISSLEQGPVNLRHVESRDRSAPVIEAILLKKQYDRRELVTSIRGAIQLKVLKYDQINDRSAPKIDPSVRIRYVERKKFLNTVLDGAFNFYERLIALGHAGAKTAGDVALMAGSKANQLVNKAIPVAKETAQAAQANVRIAANDAKCLAKETAQAAQANARIVANDAKSIAMETAQAAQANARIAANDAKCLAKETAQAAQANARSVAADLIDAGKDTAHAAQVRAAELLDAGMEKAAASARAASIQARKVRYTFADLYASGKELFMPSSTDAHQQLLADIKANRQLVHVEATEIRDRSKPFQPASSAMWSGARTVRVMDNRARVLTEITHKATLSRPLNHVSTRESKPMLPSQVKDLHKNDRKLILEEVKCAKLSHNAECCDRSAPALPQGKIDLAKCDRKELLQEVSAGVELHHNTLVMDRSKPMIPSM